MSRGDRKAMTKATRRSFRKFETRLDSVGLRKEIKSRALKLHVTLRELYEGPDRAPSIAAARRAVYTWLMEGGKGLNEVARLFDRAPSGIVKLTRGAEDAE
jgi:hypothetical protein